MVCFLHVGFGTCVADVSSVSPSSEQTGGLWGVKGKFPVPLRVTISFSSEQPFLRFFG